MTANQGFSNVDDRKYIGKVLFIFGIIAAVAATVVAWPALSHLLRKIIS